MMYTVETRYGPAEIELISATDPHGVRVVVVPGFGEGLQHTKELGMRLAKSGLNVTLLSQPRGGPLGDYLFKNPIERQGAVTLSLVEATRDLESPDENVYALAHSLGAAAALGATIQYDAARAPTVQPRPQLFKGFILMESPGTAGKQSLPDQLLRTIADIPRDRRFIAEQSDTGLQERAHRAFIAGIGFIASQPFLAICEAMAIGSYSLYEPMAKVAELGMPIYVVTAHGDGLFRYDEIDLERLSSIATVLEVVDSTAPHNDCWFMPQRTADLTCQLIDMMTK